MSTVIVLGVQWGDEGKGKVTDFLAASADVVVRCQGGNNAGHTVVVGDACHKMHLIPAGILNPDATCVIGNGVVVDIEVLLEEMHHLQEQNIPVGKLLLSDRSHLIMPYHKKLDELQEKLKGDKKIGTTKRGIGPAYIDKVARTGIRMGDLLNAANFKQKLIANLEEKNHLFASYGEETMDIEAIVAQYEKLIPLVAPMIVDTVSLINESISAGKKVLFEGAQGTLLDIDHGTYPFVTSSNPTAGGVCVGAGVGPTRIDRILGISKAYTTRVGSGPFPTEIFDEMGDKIREEGAEYGVTTGRPRRCGWFDGVVARYSTMVNGFTDLAITKIDVLDKLPEIKICVAYELNGEIIHHFPGDLDVLAQCKPVYETMPGWLTDTSKVRCYADLPENAKKYLARLSELSEAQVSIVAVGPDREQTIVVNELFK